MFIVLTYNLIFFYLLSRLVSSFNFFWQSYIKYIKWNTKNRENISTLMVFNQKISCER